MKKLTCTVLLLSTACGDNLTFPEHDPYVGGVPPAWDCVPNLDGRIDDDELLERIGVGASYLVSPAGETRDVDLVGIGSGSARRWDWSVSHTTDQAAQLAPAAVSERWYASSFDAAAFVLPVDAASDLEAVYLSTAGATLLLGFASRRQTPPEGQTLLVFTQALELYRFPIDNGASWQSIGQVQNGTFLGLPFAATYTYDFAVDGGGELVLPDMTFTQVHRLRQTTTIVPLVGVITIQRQASFLFECFGEVARATSRFGELSDDFTTASEVRRLGL